MGYINELLLLGLLVFSLVSCKSADGISPNSELNHIIDNGSQSESGAKIYLSEASSEQLAEKIEECPANANDHKQCFVVCHVPQGNPKNCHSLIVPMPAVNAHMGHGHNGHSPEKSDKGKGKGKEKEKGEYRGDYMGRCDGSGTGGTTGGTDGGTTGTTDGGTTGGTTGGDPVFCEWTMPNDLDCDGRDDVTGDLIF